MFKYFEWPAGIRKSKAQIFSHYKYTILFVVPSLLVPRVSINSSLALNFQMACGRYQKNICAWKLQIQNFVHTKFFFTTYGVRELDYKMPLALILWVVLWFCSFLPALVFCVTKVKQHSWNIPSHFGLLLCKKLSKEDFQTFQRQWIPIQYIQQTARLQCEYRLLQVATRLIVYCMYFQKAHVLMDMWDWSVVLWTMKEQLSCVRMGHGILCALIGGGTRKHL